MRSPRRRTSRPCRRSWRTWRWSAALPSMTPSCAAGWAASPSPAPTWASAMHLRQIEAFQAVIEAGTFSRAAARLRVSQPTISKLIGALERTLGYALFERAAGRIVPTAAALVLHREVQRAWVGIERLTSVAQALRTAAPARLVIGCSPMLAMGFVPQLLALFRAAHLTSSSCSTPTTCGR
ncbi:LysR family transcriptional regulator [Vineibacter terrae]|uniref:LysR family transcriptional regulator n=2 Tax=Vineibacter terrae TaxID=2586908 RepID=A0A5C8PTX6_9HYPH|nr:LysR family transcriptional regulator [Vineibacter terrae]